MAITKETLKKHHFWILVGITPLLVLIAVIMIDTGVGAAIDKKTGEHKVATDALKGKESPKSEVLIGRFGEQLIQLGMKRTDLWKENWERQIGLGIVKAAGKDAIVQDPARNLLRWPNSPKLLNRFNYTVEYATNKAQLKFGDRIPDDLGEDGEFKKPEIYLAEFSNPNLRDPAREPEKRTGMADRIYPTTFAGSGWSSVLRHVQAGPGGWGDFKPTSEQLWLALEDIWVQRAMLSAISSVNDQIGEFVLSPKAEDAKLDRAFSSRIWYLTIKAAQRPGDNRYVLTGTIRNMTDRLQLLGAGNMMVLNVWLSPAANALPVSFRIGGEFVPGGATLAIAQSDEHVLPAGTAVEEIAKVLQVFDGRTVPIRRIDHLAMGYRDSRYAAFPLLTPLFASYRKETDAAAAAATASSSADPMVGVGSTGSSSGQPSGLGGNKGTPGAPGGPGAGAASDSSGVIEGGGSVAGVLDGNKKRYIDVTDQIRRMPVAITVIVDQAYMQDVLLAYANMPMRFQVTQYHWQRFRGSLGASAGGSTGGSTGGTGIGGDSEIGGPARGTEGAGGIKFGSTGSSFGPPGGSGAGRPPMPPGGPGPGPGPGGFGGPMGPGGPGPSGSGGAGPGALSTISESQLSAGLVELTLYGIVSLYEKYEVSSETPTITP